MEELDSLATRDYLAAHPEAQLVDVREEWEYAQGRLPGAVLIPLGEITTRYGELDPGRPVVLVCAAGVRSYHAGCFLAKQGFGALINVADGTHGWVAKGLPVES